MVVNSYAEVHALLTLDLANAIFPLHMRQRVIVSRFIALLATVWLALTYHSAVRRQDPWFGTWNLNLAKSNERPDATRYKRVTSRIEPWQDGLKVSYDMVGIRGGVTHTEWMGRFDGKDYPMQGLDYVMTNAYRRIDDRSYEIVIKIDGTIAATAHVSVSPDGKVLNVSTDQRTADGKTSRTMAVYDKQ
jgi:hypothetical protein